MAMKLGTESKWKVITVGVLLCVMVYLVISQMIGGSSAPATRAAAPTQPVPTPRQAQAPAPSANAGPEARKHPGLALDPSLHLDKLMASEGVEYAGTGRNIFSAESAPIPIPEPLGPARASEAAAIAQGPPQPPQPPGIDLRYFGYAFKRDGKRAAFFLHGDDVFEAYAGDIVNHRYKVVAVDIHSAQVTDLSYNNTQTLPLVAN
jgi:hypothetical protein